MRTAAMDFHHLVQLFCIIALDCLVLEIVLGNEDNTAKFTRIDCLSVNPEYIQNITCRVKAVRRNLYLLNIRATIVKPLDNISVRIRLFKKAFSYKPFLVDVSENLCDFLSKKHVSVYMKIIGGIYLPYSNFNSSCPVVGLTIFKDMPLNANLLPSIWPTGEYRIVFEIKRIDKVVITLRIDFVLDEKISDGIRIPVKIL